MGYRIAFTNQYGKRQKSGVYKTKSSAREAIRNM